MQKTAEKRIDNIRKLQNFENWEKWPYCKGHSKAKSSVLGTDFKMPRTRRRRL